MHVLGGGRKQENPERPIKSTKPKLKVFSGFWKTSNLMHEGPLLEVPAIPSILYVSVLGRNQKWQAVESGRLDFGRHVVTLSIATLSYQTCREQRKDFVVMIN